MTPFMQTLLLFAFFICPVAALLFIIRLVVAPFSAKVSEEMRRNPGFHLIWGCFAFVGVLFFLGIVEPNMWPPASVERREQRAKVIERVQAAGGWDAIRRGCIILAEQNTNGFYSHWHDTNGLPTAIIALKPMLVEYVPPYGCVRIRIFGMHSTGGHSTPYFGLEVDTSTNSASYKHGMGYENGGVIGNHHSIYNQVAEAIYEVY
jgi:hypothetical protein